MLENIEHVIWDLDDMTNIEEQRQETTNFVISFDNMFQAYVQHS